MKMFNAETPEYIALLTAVNAAIELLPESREEIRGAIRALGRCVDDRVEHSEYFYTTRIRVLEDWVRKHDGVVDEAVVKEFFDLLANGSTPQYPSYQGLYNAMKYAKDSAEKKLAQAESVIGIWKDKYVRLEEMFDALNTFNEAVCEYDCTYLDNCPRGTRHGTCVGCMARQARAQARLAPSKYDPTLPDDEDVL